MPTDRRTTIPNDSGPISSCFDDDPKLSNCEILVAHLLSLSIGYENYNFYLGVFGQFPAELGPETPLLGSGSKNGAERTQN